MPENCSRSDMHIKPDYFDEYVDVRGHFDDGTFLDEYAWLKNAYIIQARIAYNSAKIAAEEPTNYTVSNAALSEHKCQLLETIICLLTDADSIEKNFDRLIHLISSDSPVAFLKPATELSSHTE